MKNKQIAVRARYRNALEALQAQSSSATVMLEKKIKLKSQSPERRTLKSAQQRMKECEPETSHVWRYVMSGQAGKSIPDLTIRDLEPLIAGRALVLAEREDWRTSPVYFNYIASTIQRQGIAPLLDPDDFRPAFAQLGAHCSERVCVVLEFPRGRGGQKALRASALNALRAYAKAEPDGFLLHLLASKGNGGFSWAGLLDCTKKEIRAFWDEFLNTHPRPRSRRVVQIRTFLDLAPLASLS